MNLLKQGKPFISNIIFPLERKSPKYRELEKSFEVISNDFSMQKKGTQPLSKSFVELLEGSVAILAIKIAEDDPSRLILRLYETDGVQTDAFINCLG